MNGWWSPEIDKSSVPFCFREATWSLPSASRTCSVPWSPAAVTWFPLRQHRSTGPVYSHDTSVKSGLSGGEQGRRPGSIHGGEVAIQVERRWIRRGASSRRAPLCLMTIWASRPRSAWFEAPVVKLAVAKYAISAASFQNKVTTAAHPVYLCCVNHREFD